MVWMHPKLIFRQLVLDLHYTLDSIIRSEVRSVRNMLVFKWKCDCNVKFWEHFFDQFFNFYSNFTRVGWPKRWKREKSLWYDLMPNVLLFFHTSKNLKIGLRRYALTGLILRLAEREWVSQPLIWQDWKWRFGLNKAASNIASFYYSQPNFVDEMVIFVLPA